MENNFKDNIYEILLEDITLLRYKPGDFLKEADLSSRFNVSRTPLREVVKRLALEGYIQVLPRHGNKVSLIDTDIVKQMMEMRVVLETAVEKQLAFSISPEQLSTLREIMKKQEDAVAESDSEAFWLLDNEFHEKLFLYAGKSVWWDTIKKYEAHYMRFRKLEMTDNTNYELLYIHHKNLLKNIIERRIEEIEPSIRTHVGTCLERLPVLMDKYPSYFKGQEQL